MAIQAIGVKGGVWVTGLVVGQTGYILNIGKGIELDDLGFNGVLYNISPDIYGQAFANLVGATAIVPGDTVNWEVRLDGNREASGLNLVTLLGDPILGPPDSMDVSEGAAQITPSWTPVLADGAAAVQRYCLEHRETMPIIAGAIVRTVAKEPVIATETVEIQGRVYYVSGSLRYRDINAVADEVQVSGTISATGYNVWPFVLLDRAREFAYVPTLRRVVSGNNRLHYLQMAKIDLSTGAAFLGPSRYLGASANRDVVNMEWIDEETIWVRLGTTNAYFNATVNTETVASSSSSNMSRGALKFQDGSVWRMNGDDVQKAASRSDAYAVVGSVASSYLMYYLHFDENGGLWGVHRSGGTRNLVLIDQDDFSTTDYPAQNFAIDHGDILAPESFERTSSASFPSFDRDFEVQAGMDISEGVLGLTAAGKPELVLRDADPPSWSTVPDLNTTLRVYVLFENGYRHEFGTNALQSRTASAATWRGSGVNADWTTAINSLDVDSKVMILISPALPALPAWTVIMAPMTEETITELVPQSGHSLRVATRNAAGVGTEYVGTFGVANNYEAPQAREMVVANGLRRTWTSWDAATVDEGLTEIRVQYRPFVVDPDGFTEGHQNLLEDFVGSDAEIQETQLISGQPMAIFRTLGVGEEGMTAGPEKAVVVGRSRIGMPLPDDS